MQIRYVVGAAAIVAIAAMQGIGSAVAAALVVGIGLALFRRIGSTPSARTKPASGPHKGSLLAQIESSSWPPIGPGAPGPTTRVADGKRPMVRSDNEGSPALNARLPSASHPGRSAGLLRRIASPRMGGIDPEPPAPDVRSPSYDPAQCSVYCPPTIRPETSFLVQVWAHFDAQSSSVARLARQFDSNSRLRAFQSLAANPPVGARLMFDLRLPTLEVHDPVQSMIWHGRSELVDFEVTVPGTAIQSQVIGTVGVACETVPIGHLKFQIEVRDQASGQARALVEAKRYRRAFISHASADRAQVLPRVQMLQSMGIDVFQDVMSLEPGEEWEPALFRAIDDCDLFLLFWSSNAKKSRWVHREVRHALKRKGGDDKQPPEIRPVIIEGPPVPKPWSELAHLHFNDRLLYLAAVPG